MAEAKVAAAKAKYAKKVCEGYLGVSKTACERVFDKLYANMKAAYEAMA
jgi:hypothetical protein